MVHWLVPVALLTVNLAAAPLADRPNIVLLIADDLGAEDLPSFGNKAVKAPNLTRLAARGMRFDRAFVVTSSCSPSRCSLLTGRYPHSHGAPRLHEPLPADQVTFVEKLKEAGYYTAIAGKTHVGPSALKAFDLVAAGGGPSGCGNWVESLKGRPKDRPFLAWLAAVDPHRDYQPGTIPDPHQPADVVIPPYLPDNPSTRKDLALYYDEVARLDTFIGDVLDELDRQGVAENTLVIFLSDNGRPFPRGKTTLYDSGVRTPMIIRWPAKVKPGTTCASLISSIDLGPTILTLAGLPVPKSFQGVDASPLLQDPTATVRDHLINEKNWHDFDDHARSVRTPRYNYIRNSYTDIPLTPPADAVRGPTFQEMIRLNDQGKLPDNQRACFTLPRPAELLFDTEADPQELVNLADDPRHAETLIMLRETLNRWAEQTHDRVPQTRTSDRYDRRTGEALHAPPPKGAR